MAFAGKKGGRNEAYWMKERETERERERLRSVHAEFSSSAQTQSHHLIGTCNKFRCSGSTQLNCLATAACEGECKRG